MFLSAFFGAFFIRCALGLGITDDEGGATQTLTQMVESRGKLLDQIEAIENDPQGKHTADDSSTEKRFKKGDPSGDFSKEQRDSLATLNAQYDALDKKIEQRQKQVDRRNKQDNDEKRAKHTDLRIVPDVKRGYSEGEQRDLDKFSLPRMLRLQAEGRALDGIEAEMMQDGLAEARDSGISVNARGLMVSGKALQSAESRDLSVTGGTGGNKGGLIVPTEKMGMLDSLMYGNPIAQLGGTVLTNLVGNFDLPRIVDGTAPTGKSENASSDEYDPTVAVASFAPNRLPVVVEVSAQLLMQGNEQALMAFLQNHLRRKIAAVMGRACINGTGTNEAEGILQASGIGAVVGGTNGLAPAWSHIVGLETAVANDEALAGNLSYLINSKTTGKLKVTPKVASTDSNMILDDRSAGMLNGHDYLSNNAVPSDLTKGTAEDICSALIFGNFADYYLTQWSGIEFLVNPFSKDSEGLVRINASIFYDGHVVRPESFAAKQDALTA